MIFCAWFYALHSSLSTGLKGWWFIFSCSIHSYPLQKSTALMPGNLIQQLPCSLMTVRVLALNSDQAITYVQRETLTVFIIFWHLSFRLIDSDNPPLTHRDNLVTVCLLPASPFASSSLSQPCQPHIWYTPNSIPPFHFQCAMPNSSFRNLCRVLVSRWSLPQSNRWSWLWLNKQTKPHLVVFFLCVSYLKALRG